jgi:hypothetical protein
VDILDLGDRFPFPSGVQRTTALVMLAAVPGGCPIDNERPFESKASPECIECHEQ